MRQIQRQDSIAVNFRAENITKEIPRMSPCVFTGFPKRVLRNISRHAEQRKLTISLVGKNDTIHLTIMDIGNGFDSDQVKGIMDWAWIV